MKQVLKGYSGIITAAVYALALRLIFNYPHGHYAWSLFSITFVWIVPIIIGIIPIFFANDEQLKSTWYRNIAPPLAVTVFLFTAIITKIEDLVCILIIGFPFFLISWVSGNLAAYIIGKYRKNKGLWCFVALMPFVISPVEQRFENPSEIFNVTSAIIIRANEEEIWANIIRVPEIQKTEYQKGFFNYAGIPRPLYAELSDDTLGAIRTGHFEGGLTFKETVTNWEPNKMISFDIKITSSPYKQTILEQHVLKSDHFRFVKATYKLEKIDKELIKLTLASSYQLDTKINLYGSLWGNLILSDFQNRLLKVIKNRCE